MVRNSSNSNNPLTTTKQTDRCSPFQAVPRKIFVSNINKLLLLLNNLWPGIVENLTGIRKKNSVHSFYQSLIHKEVRAKPSV